MVDIGCGGVRGTALCDGNFVCIGILGVLSAAFCNLLTVGGLGTLVATEALSFVSSSQKADTKTS